MQRNWVLAAVLVFSVSVAMAKSHTPAANTHAAIKSYVESAAAVVHKHGPSCATFSSKDWMSGDYYVFVQGADGKLLCHPNASLVGKPASDVVDANGKKVGVEIFDVAKKGGGWTEYVWPRPGTTVPVAKSTYSMEVKGPDGKEYVVGAGGYEVK